ncbi:metallophosphoesterase [Methylobacterium oryzae]|uniref:Metallophosphoesterase n=1 Tax=Methylobacterium oryzae TaxID=334852 RepID=A0ABU7TU41_9HYPH
MNLRLDLPRPGIPHPSGAGRRWLAPGLLADVLASAQAQSDDRRRARRAFWVLSDLRLDLDPRYALPDPPPDFDAVLVAGNVAPGLSASLRGLDAVLGGRQGDKPVFVVPGCVEYRSDVPLVEALARGRDLAAELGFVLLSDDAVRFGPPHGDGTVVIGATLWTDWSLGASREVPSARILARTAWDEARLVFLRRERPLTPLDSLAMHARSRAYIEDALTSVIIRSLDLGGGPNACVDCALPGDVAVVLTCHAPTPRSLPADWEGWDAAPWVAASRASEASASMEAWGAPRLWVHGHVPRAADHVVGRTRVVANPRVGERGYDAFDPTRVVNV